jgi:diazepam-binding inhibitor (GABA receptor modulator, acyl-CoA-binding protein)
MGTVARVARGALSCTLASMATMDEFEAAQVRVKTFRTTPSPAELLELYALFKQGTLGDVSGARPGMLDIKGRAKFDAWEKKKGQSQDIARAAYVKLVDALGARYA